MILVSPLGLLVVAMAGLLPLGAAAAVRPRIALPAAAVVCAAAALVNLGFLAAGAAPAQLALPLGLPGSGMVLALDGLSGFFALPVLLVGAACCLAAAEEPDGAAALPLTLAALLLALLAADAFALVAGVAAAGFGGGALVLAGPGRAARLAARQMSAIAAFGTVCLLAALALLARPGADGIDISFAAMRSQPPEGALAAVVVVLSLAGGGALAALAPLHPWLPRTLAAAPAAGGAALGGAVTTCGLYVLARLLLDLAGPAQPGWWGAPLMVLGGAGALLGGMRAVLADEVPAALGGASVGQVGLVAVALGLALAARGADLPGLAALALGAALLLVLAHALFAALLALAAGAAQRGAGTRRLDRLGGLARRMPVTTCCVLAGAASLAGLPPGSGFAADWALLQALLGSLRVGGIAMQVLAALAALAVGFGIALAAVAAVRLVGIGFLGRPRTPRAAAAQEPGPGVRAVLLALAGSGLLVGLFPGLVLRLAAPALGLAVGGDMAGRAGALLLAPQLQAPGYAALAVALLLALGLVAAWAVLRRSGAEGHRLAPAWDGGGATPPPWLPFGDPATQSSGAGFSEMLRTSLGALPAGGRDPAEALLLRPLLRLRRRAMARAAALSVPSGRRGAAALLVALVLLLVAVALAGPS